MPLKLSFRYLRLLLSWVVPAFLLYACLPGPPFVQPPLPAKPIPVTPVPVIPKTTTPVPATALPVNTLLAAPSPIASLQTQPIAAVEEIKHYIAPSGSNNNAGTIDRPWLTIQYAVDHAQPGDILVVRSGSYIENVVIRKKGTAAAPITLMAYPQEKGVIDGRTDAAISAVDAASYWIIDGLTIQCAGRYALRIGWWSDPLTNNWIIRNNNIYGANFLMGFNHLWENNNIDGTGYTGTQGDAGITEGGDSHNNIFRGNTIHDFTQKEARGIWSQGKTHDSLMENNTVRNITDTSGSSKGQCIDLDGAAQVEWRHTVRGNRIINCNYVGIQLENAFDSVIENNLIVNTQSAAIIVINYNADTGCKTGGESNQYGDQVGKGDCRGVDLHSSLLQNIILNGGDVGGIVSYASTGVKVYQNLVYASGVALYIHDSPIYSKNWDVRGNIFSNNNRAEISISDPASFSFENNNLIYHPAGDLFFEVRSPSSTFYSFSQWQNKYKLDANSINADPAFVNAAKLDFHLQPHSPAVNAGVNLNLSADFDGQARPAGPASDIGPYQYTP